MSGDTLTVKASPIEDVHRDIARVHINHRPGTSAGDVVKITVNKKAVYRVARGTKRAIKNEIWVDHATRKELAISENADYRFEIVKAGFWGQVIWAFFATDAMPRIAARLAVLSVALGFLSLLLGLLSLYLALD